MKRINREAVRAAIDDCLSGVDALPSVRADVLKQVRGEEKVNKKISIGVIAALMLTLLMAGAALAAGLGLFGQLGEMEHSDDRLPSLEQVAEPVGVVITTEEGVTITIDQAYYDGRRVFISYVQSGPFETMELGEGRPEGVTDWDMTFPGEGFGESIGIDGPEHLTLLSHLNSGVPSWAVSRSVNVHDGLQFGDVYLDIIGGETYRTADDRLIGWKECVIPPELAQGALQDADEVTFLLGTFTSSSTYYQDETGLYIAFGPRPETAWHPFTVKKDQAAHCQVTGEAAGAEWTASAALEASAIDMKGQILLVCPQSWTEIERTWENPEGIDYVRDWQLYVGGEPVERPVVEGVNPGVDGQLTFDVCIRMSDASQELRLVPVYCMSGEHMDEAMHLKMK